MVVTCRPDINLCSSFTRVNNKLTALIVRDEATKFSSFVQRNEGTEAPKLKSSSHPDTATSTPIPNTLSRCTSGRIMIRSATTMPYTIELTVVTTSSTVHCLNLGPHSRPGSHFSSMKTVYRHYAIFGGEEIGREVDDICKGEFLLLKAWNSR